MKRFTKESLLSAGREALAFAKQAVAHGNEPRGLAPEHVRDGDDVVVLLHGLFASAASLEPLRREFLRHPGLHVAFLSYPPGPGIEALSERLAALVAELPGLSRLYLVGHSLGGVVARHYAQTSGDARVVLTISLASPFAGVALAPSLGFQAAKDLSPESALLRELRLASASFTHIPHLSIIASDDAVLRSPITHALPSGEVVMMQGRGHNALLFDEEARDLVERRVLEARKASRSSSVEPTNVLGPRRV